MKKRIAIVMCAVVLSMTACANTDAENTSEEVVVEEGAEVVVNLEEEAENAEAPVAEAVVYTPGVYTETGYDAEWLGYRFTTPEGCTLATQEELLALLGLSTDLVADDTNKALADYAKQSVVLDLSASYVETGSNMNIAVQNTSTNGFTLEQIVEASAAQLESLEAMATTVAAGREMVEIAGREYMKLTAVCEANGVSLNQDIYTTILPEQVIVITVSSTEGNEAEAEALLAGLSAM